MVQLPQVFLSQMRELLNDEFGDYLSAMEQPARRAVRLNTKKISTEHFLRIAPFPVEPVPWCAEAFYYSGDVRPGTHPFAYAGLYYLQEASACLPVSILPVEENDLILDVCAAPGGKSSYAAAKLKGGLLVSNDISASRQNATLKNLERAGAASVFVTCADPERFLENNTCLFDKIICDVPCSGEGMFRKDPSLISHWLERGNDAYIPLQKKILSNALKLLRPGGILVYSTCTFSVRENEEVILDALSRDSSLRIIPPSFSCGCFSPGVLPGTENCIRLYPHRASAEGHFAALIKKEGSAPQRVPVSRSSFTHPALSAFLENISFPFETGSFQKHGEQILWIPASPFDNSGIRTMRSGLLAGTLKNDRFEPSQALAFALSADTFRHSLRLSPDDERVMRYLHGETISSEETEDGWVLVCAENYPLGFGRKQGRTIKNKIGREYRII